MSTLDRCPNCEAKYKRYPPIDPSIVQKINALRKEAPISSYCKKCAPLEIGGSIVTNSATIESYQQDASKLLKYIPVLSTHLPYKWEYESLGLVTGQATLGTGAFAEFKSGFTDFFGTDSKTYNNKIRSGEISSLHQLRSKTLKMGGNAVIAADIDYSELGSLKGMIMVCATGTAIKLKNLEVISKEKQENLKLIEDILSNIEDLSDKNIELNKIHNEVTKS